MKIIHFSLLLMFLTLGCNPFLKNTDDPPLEQISLPEGFKIGLFARDIKNARSMTLGEEGTLFVGSRDAGVVYAVVDDDGDYQADSVYVLAGNLNSPNGVAFHNGDLYVAEIHRIIKFPQVEQHLSSPSDYQVVFDQYPEETHHGWKYIAFGPDGKLYVPVGAPCNICKSEDRIFASITRIDPNGGDFEIFAEGIRNTVGFDWHPETQELWFTDNGRDWLGDNRPPDELNKAPEAGLHFGYPFCHGTSIADPEFGDNVNCDEYVKPEINLGPHVAALGMKFYTGDMFPEKYKNHAFIAEHGSWNRTSPVGYRVTLVEIQNNLASKYTVFAEGWLQGGQAWGRPVDVLQLPDGSLLVSDDHAGVIYRIYYAG